MLLDALESRFILVPTGLPGSFSNMGFSRKAVLRFELFPFLQSYWRNLMALIHLPTIKVYCLIEKKHKDVQSNPLKLGESNSRTTTYRKGLWIICLTGKLLV
ncbi:hypothetical protein LXL04_031220 [Taraxacum kok-saghyz]